MAATPPSHSLTQIALHAQMQRLKSRERALEWLMAGLAMSVAYAMFVLMDRERFFIKAIDFFVWMTSLGGAYLMMRYEWHRGRDWGQLARELCDRESVGRSPAD